MFCFSQSISLNDSYLSVLVFVVSFCSLSYLFSILKVTHYESSKIHVMQNSFFFCDNSKFPLKNGKHSKRKWLRFSNYPEVKWSYGNQISSKAWLRKFMFRVCGSCCSLFSLGDTILILIHIFFNEMKYSTPNVVLWTLIIKNWCDLLRYFTLKLVQSINK